MTATTVENYTRTQLANPITRGSFLRWQGHQLRTVLTSEHDFSDADIELLCTTGATREGREHFQQVLLSVVNHTGTGMCIDQLRKMLVVYAPVNQHIVWQLLSMTHRLRGDMYEADSIDWLMGFPVGDADIH